MADRSGGEASGVATPITTDEVRRRADQGAQLLEVLPPADFRKEHLPGAVNIPLPQLTPERSAELDRDRAVIVYCYDTECDLSSRGAALLSAYGFPDVYDYTGSKVEWLARGLPAEGTVPADHRAGGVARPAATCPPDTKVADLPAAGPGGVVLVVDDAGVVLGAVRPDTVTAVDVPVLEVLQPGPSSVRPSITVGELAGSMDRRGESYVVVSTLDGVLIGIAERDDLRAVG